MYKICTVKVHIVLHINMHFQDKYDRGAYKVHIFHRLICTFKVHLTLGCWNYGKYLIFEIAS
jgi:hypothetical protein